MPEPPSRHVAPAQALKSLVLTRVNVEILTLSYPLSLPHEVAATPSCLPCSCHHPLSPVGSRVGGREGRHPPLPQGTWPWPPPVASPAAGRCATSRCRGGVRWPLHPRECAPWPGGMVGSHITRRHRGPPPVVTPATPLTNDGDLFLMDSCDGFMGFGDSCDESFDFLHLDAISTWISSCL